MTKLNDLQNAIMAECWNRIHAPTDSGQVRKDRLESIESLSDGLNVTVTLPDQWGDRGALKQAAMFPNFCINAHLSK